MKKNSQKPKMTRTTGSSVKTKKEALPSEQRVHRTGDQTYEAYADHYWDQAP